DIVDQTSGLRMHRAAERTDHARGNAGLKTKRVSDRNDDLADAQTLRIRQAHVRKVRRIDPNHSEIRIGIIADQLRRILAPVRQAHRNLIRVVNDVADGQNETVRVNDETGSTAPDFTVTDPSIEQLFD